MCTTWLVGQVVGGVCQISILLHKPYYVKWSTKGEGGSKNINSVHMIYEWPHTLLYGRLILFHMCPNEMAFSKIRKWHNFLRFIHTRPMGHYCWFQFSNLIKRCSPRPRIIGNKMKIIYHVLTVLNSKFWQNPHVDDLFPFIKVFSSNSTVLPHSSDILVLRNIFLVRQPKLSYKLDVT